MIARKQGLQLNNQSLTRVNNHPVTKYSFTE